REQVQTRRRRRRRQAIGRRLAFLLPLRRRDRRQRRRRRVHQGHGDEPPRRRPRHHELGAVVVLLPPLHEPARRAEAPAGAGAHRFPQAAAAAGAALPRQRRHGDVRRERGEEPPVPARGPLRGHEAVPAGAFGAQGGGRRRRAPQRARGDGRRQGAGVLLLHGEDEAGVGQGLQGVQAGAVDHRGRQAAVRAVEQVRRVQLRAEDMPRQGDGARADEGHGGGHGVELCRGGGAGARRGAEAVRHTPHEEWALGKGQEKRASDEHLRTERIHAY
ncbi:Os03g0140400, partial [Oryza sativa Japonica Group]